MPISNLKLNHIVIDPTLQPRVNGIDPAHVAVLQAVHTSWPPIAVVERDGQFVLIDGAHRFAAAQNLGLAEILANVLPMPQDEDLVALAFALNAIHGRHLTASDRSAFGARQLSLHPEVSNMEIARRAGLSPSTVAAIRARLEADAAIAPASERLGADGVRYPAPTPARPSGELPSVGIGAFVSHAVGKLISPGERAQQRKIVQYLERLAVALEDQEQLDGWDDANQAAEACAVVLGEGRAKQLAERLGWTARNVLNAAIALGYRDEDIAK